MNKKKVRMRRKVVSSIFLILIIGLTLSLFYGAVAGGSEQSSYIKVTVQPGDTLWKIAKDNSIQNNKDVRCLIYEIRQVNNLQTATLMPGQIIKIPTN